MKNTIFYLGILIIALQFASCKKSTSSAVPSAKSIITGTWLGILIASDNNGNGIMDTSEIFYFTGPSSYDSITFKSDGTGHDHMHIAYSGTTIYDTSFSFNWVLSADEKSLSGVVPVTSASAATIDSLSSTEVKLSYTAPMKNWRKYRKI